jgi:hypothetical protein
MAVTRCDSCGKPERSKRLEYVFVAEPLGYPDPKIRCGKKGCQNPARIWLYVVDAMAYKNRGQRVFSLPFHPAKRVTLGDGGHFFSERRDAGPSVQGDVTAMNDSLRRRIRELKRQYPDSDSYIESELQDYLKADGPPDDSEFYFLLKRRLEIDHPKPVKQKQPYTGRRSPGRTYRR